MIFLRKRNMQGESGAYVSCSNNIAISGIRHSSNSGGPGTTGVGGLEGGEGERPFHGRGRARKLDPRPKVLMCSSGVI